MVTDHHRGPENSSCHGRISHCLISELPKLAWGARLGLRKNELQVWHGAAVEVGGDFAVEGVWNGDFPAGGFDTTDCFFGSGIVARDNEIVFVTSAGITDQLFYSVRAEILWVSNSLSYLLAILDDRLRPDCLEYDRINDSVTLGINEYTAEIPTAKGNVNRLIYRNLRVGGGKLELFEKRMPPKFTDYDSYKDYLIRNYALIASNARSKSRRCPLRILTTQSRGYDTTAVNAIAAPYGIDMAYTVPQSKGRQAWGDHDAASQGDDDGTAICQILKIPCRRIDRRAFEKGFTEERLFFASLHNNEDANLLEMIRDIHVPSIVLTGVMGQLWYTSAGLTKFPPATDRELRRGDPAMHGLAEVRLERGFIQVPVCFIGARSRPEILRISESDELKPYSLPQEYNRPVARRIAEEAGIPRSAFGQSKKASTVGLRIPPLPVTASLSVEYFKFLRHNRLISGTGQILFPLYHRINEMIYFRSPTKYRLIYYFERMVSKLAGSEYSLPLIHNKLNGSLYCFCVNKVAGEYERALGKHRLLGSRR